MATLATKVKLYLTANSKTWDSEQDNIILQNDGSGDYIKSWTYLAQPSDSQIASYETAAGNTDETNNNVRATRRAAYVILVTSWMKSIKILTLSKTRIKAIKDANPKVN